MRVGSIVEYLISIKDKHKMDLTFDEIEALNDACNILSHRFPRMTPAETLIEDSVAGYEVSKTEVMDWLHEAGYLGNEKNATILMAQQMPEDMALAMKNRAQETVFEFIRMCRKELERI